jgi:hypothetical protein
MSDVPQPPPLPWVNGEGQTVVDVVVTVCRDNLDRTWSSHDLASNKDRETVLKWPSGGLRHISDALFIEALRRRANLTLLRKMSVEPTFLDSLKVESKEQQRILLQGVVETVSAELRSRVEALTEAAVWDAVLELLE